MNHRRPMKYSGLLFMNNDVEKTKSEELTPTQMDVDEGKVFLSMPDISKNATKVLIKRKR